MELSKSAQIEYLILEETVPNGQKSPMAVVGVEDVNEVTNNFRNRNYKNLARQAFEAIGDDMYKVEVLSDLETILKKHFDSLELGQRWEFFGRMIGCVQLFVELNFTGKQQLKEGKQDETEIEKLSSVILKESVIQSLSLDGENIYPVIKNLELFVFSNSFFKAVVSNEPVLRSLAFKWWQFRCLWIHQQLLQEKSEFIFNQANILLESVSELDRAMLNDKAKIHFHLEVATFYFNYFDIQKIKQAVTQACDIAGISVQETGALGKRTKFQQKELAQLTLDICHIKTSAVSENDNSFHLDVNQEAEEDLPQDLKLDDEVRLDKIAFSENRPKTNLSATECALILSQFYFLKRSQPKDSLFKEELVPYLDTILGNSNTNWSLRSMALLERTKLEKDESRSIERSLMQMQTLVDSLPWKFIDSHHRLDMIYSIKPVPFWILENELVKILKSVGSIKTALDLALKLKLWEEVIDCYHILDLRHKAVEVITKQMETEGETPILYCMLGDANDDPANYQKAIELSGGRSARAFRSLGTYYFHRKNYEKAVEYLGKSLELNSFHLKTLLRHGFAAMEIKAWDIAANSYRNYCSYETDNFEAWNNLANAYINQGQKPRAWKVLQEAAKCDYDNWKVWDNIMVVSTDCAHFEEIIRAYHRILDIKNAKHVDADVLKILVHAITNDLKDNYDRSSKMFKKSAKELFGRLTSENSTESILWELYGDLISSEDNNSENISEEDMFKAGQYMQKATATFMQSNKDWHKTSTQIKQGLDLAVKYTERCLRVSEITTNKIQSIQQMSSAKMTIRSMLSKIKQNQMENSTEEVVTALKNVENGLNKLVQEIERLKS